MTQDTLNPRAGTTAGSMPSTTPPSSFIQDSMSWASGSSWPAAVSYQRAASGWS
jgi:hypothetical protein